LASKGIVARVGLIGAVAVIVAVSTLSPLLKQPAPANDTAALVAFAPPLPGAAFAPPATLEVSERAAEPAPSANSLATTDASARPSPPPEASAAKPASPSAAPAPAVAAMHLPSVERPEASAPISTQPTAVESPPAPPIVAASEPPKAEKRARAKRSANQGRRVAGPRATPFSYNQQLAAH
jgi:hypothetical protein